MSKPSKNKQELLPLKDIKNKILCNYNLNNPKIETVKFKDTDKQRAVYRISNNNEYYCLKKVYYDEGNLLYVYSVMEWLYRNEIHLPRLLPTNKKGRFVKYNNMIFILSPWIEGEKCDFDNYKHINLSIRTLANLHKVSKNFTPIKGSYNRTGFVDFNTSIKKHFNQLIDNADKASKIRDTFSNIYLEHLDYNIELAKNSLEFSSQINTKDLTSSLCHGDFVNKNIIIQNSTPWLIDFDKCQMDYSAHDLAYFLRRLLKRDNTNWDIELTMNILYEYIETNRLTKSDIRYIYSYICFPQKFWKISRDYYRNLKRCNKLSFENLLNKGLSRTSNQLDFSYKLKNKLIRNNLI